MHKLHDKINSVKRIYHHFKNKNKFKRVPLFFNGDRYLAHDTLNVLIIQIVCVTLL